MFKIVNEMKKQKPFSKTKILQKKNKWIKKQNKTPPKHKQKFQKSKVDLDTTKERITDQEEKQRKSPSMKTKKNRQEI